MIQGAPELKNKITISWYLLVAVVGLSFVLGGTITKVLDNDIQREQQKQFLLDEINGLRKDWERQYEQDVNKRLEKIEDKLDKIK